jgi:hypothetical protein
MDGAPGRLRTCTWTGFESAASANWATGACSWQASNLMFQVIAATIILLTTAIGWVAIALAAREAWKQHKQARRPS